MPVRREAAVPPPGTAGSAWRGFEASGVSVETPPAGPSRVRILLLHYTGPPVVGGVESVLAGHARLLAGRGFEVHVLTGRGGAVGDGVHVHRLTALDSRHRRVLATSGVLESGRVPAEFVILTAEILAGLRRALEGIDVCIVHNALTLDKNLALTAALHELARRGTGPRLVAWCHDLAWTNPQYRPALHAGLLLGSAAHAAPSCHLRHGVAPSAAGARRRAAPLAGGDPVIPNGVDPAAVLRLTPTGRQLATDLRLWDQQLVLLLPARITRRKQIEFALRVVAEIVRRDVAVRLLVTGPLGPHNPHNRQYLEEQVVFCPQLRAPSGRPLRLTDAAMTDLYLLADALLLPSRDEGFGLPLLAAGVARLPSFTTDLPSPREIGDDAIETFPIGDAPEAVASRLILTLTQDRGYRLRRRVLSAYTWEVIMRDRIVPLLDRLVAVGPR